MKIEYGLLISLDIFDISWDPYDPTEKRHLTIPDGVISLGIQSLYNLRTLDSISLPEGLLNICSQALANCFGLRCLITPPSLERIEELAFQNCFRLELIVLHHNIISIASNAFKRCSALSVIVINADNRIKFQATLNQLPNELQSKVITKDEYSKLEEVRSECFQQLKAQLLTNLRDNLWSSLQPNSFFSSLPSELQRLVGMYLLNAFAVYNTLMDDYPAKYLPISRDNQGIINWKLYKSELIKNLVKSLHIWQGKCLVEEQMTGVRVSLFESRPSFYDFFRKPDEKLFPQPKPVLELIKSFIDRPY